MENLRRSRRVLLAAVFGALAWTVVMAGPAGALGGTGRAATSAAIGDGAAGRSNKLDLAMVAIVISPAVAGAILWGSGPRLRRWRHVVRFRAELRRIDPVLACRPMRDTDPDLPRTPDLT